MTYKTIYGDEMISTFVTDIHGGQQLAISMNSMHRENIKWLQTFRMEYEAEKKLREESEAVRNAWEQYQVVKALATKETVK